MADEVNSKKDPNTNDASSLILGGLGIGAFGIISAAVGGAVCPICVVAAPALIGFGAYKRYKGWKSARRRANPLGVPPALTSR